MTTHVYCSRDPHVPRQVVDYWLSQAEEAVHQLPLTEVEQTTYFFDQDYRFAAEDPEQPNDGAYGYGFLWNGARFEVSYVGCNEKLADWSPRAPGYMLEVWKDPERRQDQPDVVIGTHSRVSAAFKCLHDRIRPFQKQHEQEVIAFAAKLPELLAGSVNSFFAERAEESPSGALRIIGSWGAQKGAVTYYDGKPGLVFVEPAHYLDISKTPSKNRPAVWLYSAVFEGFSGPCKHEVFLEGKQIKLIYQKLKGLLHEQKRLISDSLPR